MATIIMNATENATDTGVQCMSDMQQVATVQMQIALNKRLRSMDAISEAMYQSVQDQLQTRLERLRGENAL
jgi:hypothetical protein